MNRGTDDGKSLTAALPPAIFFRMDTCQIKQMPFRPQPRDMRGCRTPRCGRCWMEEELCICALLRPIPNTTRIAIVMPWSECCRPSNTGRLAYLLLARCGVHVRGSPLTRFALDDIVKPGCRPLVLFPDPDGEELTREHGALQGQPPTLIVPDGTWSQARKILAHEPGLAGVPRVKLPAGAASGYRLRKAKAPGQLCTFEAVARALAILEDPSIHDAMMTSFNAMVERSIKTRGGPTAPDGARHGR